MNNYSDFEKLLGNDQIELSIVKFSDLDQTKRRLDAEYYQRHYIQLFDKINKIDHLSLNDANAKLDCSAFYPSITEYYNYEGCGIPFLRVNDIQNGLVQITDNTAFLPKVVLDDNPKTIAIAQPYDIVIAKGGNTLAKLGLVTEKYPFYAICRDLIVLHTNKLLINKYFIWVFLHSEYGQSLLWRTASQTGQPHLTLPSVMDIPIPKFSKQFQKSFEELYRSSVELSEKAEENYISAENNLLDLFHLSEWKPSSINIAVKSMNSSFGISGRLDAEYYQPKYDELLKYLTRIDHKRLAEIVIIKKSIEPGSDAYQEDGIQFIRVSDISKFELFQPDVYLDQSKFDIDYLKPKKDTILLSKDGSVGIAYKVEKDLNVITSGALLHLKIINDEVLPDYLTLVLNSIIIQLQAERDAGGSIIQHWRPYQIEQVIIPILPMKQQIDLSNKIQESFKLRKESNRLIEVAKQAVEIAIEHDEADAIEFIAKLREQDLNLHPESFRDNSRATPIIYLK